MVDQLTGISLSKNSEGVWLHISPKRGGMTACIKLDHIMESREGIVAGVVRSWADEQLAEEEPPVPRSTEQRKGDLLSDLESMVIEQDRAVSIGKTLVDKAQETLDICLDRYHRSMSKRNLIQDMLEMLKSDTPDRVSTPLSTPPDMSDSENPTG